MRTAALSAAVCLSIIGICVAADADASIRRPTSIAAQGLGSALAELAADRKLYFIFATKDVVNLTTHGAAGELSAAEALSQLLSGTGLVYRFIDDSTVSILPIATAPNPGTTSFRMDADARAELHLAQANAAQATDAAAAGVDDPQSAKVAREEERRKSLDDLASVVVTGTRIIGATRASPVQSVGRDQFRAQGSTSLQDVLRDIPANFSGDYTAEATGAGQGGGITNNAYNRGRATAPNIHGLGAPATLSLINGRRLPTASNGYSVDLSMIPLLALNRVDVLADGASPIYGADAIAGVVNLVTRRDEDTIESSVRFSSPTQPGYDQLQAGQAFGKTWNGGSAFIAYQFDDEDALRAKQRERSSNLSFDSFVMPEQKQHAAYANLELEPSDSVHLGLEGLYARRHFAGTYAYFGGQNLAFDTTSNQYFAALTGDFALSDQWTLASYAQYAGAKADPKLDYGLTNLLTVVQETFAGHEVSAGATVSGTLFELRGAPVRVALGAEYRDETRSLVGFGDGFKEFDISRSVRSEFLEAQVPLASTLDATLALRHDDYSDLGDTTNPKIGLVWRALDSLRFRGTYSTSFRALSLKDQYGQVSAAIYRYVADATGPGGQSLALFINGNPSETVRPEESDNYTFGMDFTPESVPGLSLGATFFSVAYKGRIVSPNQAVTDILNLNLPDTQPFVTRNPPLALLNALLNGAAQSGSFTGQPQTPDQVQVLIDNRFANLSRSKVRGVDLDFRWHVDAGSTQLSFYDTSSIGLDYVTQAAPGTAEVDRVGNVFYPAKFKTRLGVNAVRGLLHGGLALNYVSGFDDDRYTPIDSIAAWTTVDLNFGLDTSPDAGGWLSGISAELVARNLFDSPPPFVLPAPVAPTDFPNYDPANASVIGRSLSLQLSKHW